jgi:hypothetical protein
MQAGTLTNIFVPDMAQVREQVSSSTGGGGGSGGWLRINAKRPSATVRFLPPRAKNIPFILPTAFHYIPTLEKKVRVVPCLKTINKSCPICAIDEEAKAKIGDVTKRYSFEGAKYGCGAKQVFLANVMVRATEAGPDGVLGWEGPQVFEMSFTLYKKIFGVSYNPDSVKAAIVSKYPAFNIADPLNGYAVTCTTANPPDHYNATALTKKDGAVMSGPIFVDDPDNEQIMAAINGAQDLSKLIVIPAMEVYEEGASILQANLDDAVSVMHGAGGGRHGDDTAALVMRRAGGRPAPVQEDDDEVFVAPRPKPRAVAAEPAAPARRERSFKVDELDEDI